MTPAPRYVLDTHAALWAQLEPRRLSPAAALKMAGGLDLSPAETEFFSALVEYSETREPRAKLIAGKRMLALKNRHLYRAIHEMREAAEQAVEHGKRRDQPARAGLARLLRDRQAVDAFAPASYQPLLALTTRTTSSMTGTSISTPTTVASAAPDSKPNRLMAAATASSKKFEAPISADGQATLCFSPTARFSR